MNRGIMSGIAALLMTNMCLSSSMRWFESDELAHFKQAFEKGEITREEQIRGLMAVAVGYRDMAEEDIAAGKVENPWPDNPGAVCCNILNNLPTDDKNMLPFYEMMALSTHDDVRTDAITRYIYTAGAVDALPFVDKITKNSLYSRRNCYRAYDLLNQLVMDYEVWKKEQEKWGRHVPEKSPWPKLTKKDRDMVYAFLSERTLKEEDAYHVMDLDSKLSPQRPRPRISETVAEKNEVNEVRAADAKIAENDPDRFSRLAAVYKLKDKAILEKVAKNDTCPFVRVAAVGKLSDSTLLADIVRNDADAWVRKAAATHLEDSAVLAEVALNDVDRDVRLRAVSKIDNKTILANIAWTSADFHVINAIIGSSVIKTSRIDDQVLFAKIAIGERGQSFMEQEVYSSAWRNLTNQTLLAEIVKSGKSSKRAVLQITDLELLNEIATNNLPANVRGIAMSRLQRLKEQKNTTDVTASDK